MNITITSTSPIPVVNPFEGLTNGYGEPFPKPFFLGQVLKANLDVGEENDGSDVGYPYYPGLRIRGVGYREFQYPETGLKCEELAGVVVRLPDWGFKSPIQFAVAYDLAQGFGHQWAQPTMVALRKPQPNGAVRLVEEPVDPTNPWDAHHAGNIRLMEERQRGWQDAQYTVPTPEWESGNRTFKVRVRKDGSYTIIHDGVVCEAVDRKGQRTLTPALDWLGWKPPAFDEQGRFESTGRGESLGQALALAVARCERRGYDINHLVEAFEASPKFWKTGHQAGTRWWLKAI